jgi:DNA-binding GntR family transcriptional regulator
LVNEDLADTVWSPERPTQLREQAAAYIRELIVSGQAAPGKLLRLDPLAQTLGASVTPVREAMLLLTQDGWFVQEPNRGFRVAPIRRTDVEDTYLVYSFIAGELAARAADNATKEVVSELRRLDGAIAAIAAPAERADDHVEELNYDVHALVYKTADAPRLLSLLRIAMRFVPFRLWPTIPGWLAHNRVGHAPVIDAIEAADGERARAVMTAHIRTAGELLLNHLDSVGFWDSGEQTEK